VKEREAILGRVREALRTPAPIPGSHGHAHAPVTEAAAATQIRKWLPATGATHAQRVEAFAKNSAELKTEFVVVPTEAAATAALAAIARRESWKRVATHASPLAEPVARALGLPVLSAEGGYDRDDLEGCDAGITGCDALVAQTGSVALSARSGGGRALSVLPPHHVVVASADQLVADLPDAFALLEAKYGAAYPSFLGFITGPSRTGDIERILVLGAHGPKQLTVLLIDPAAGPLTAPAASGSTGTSGAGR
jgi:L-lactate dehydrogenase complex protein LldG